MENKDIEELKEGWRIYKLKDIINMKTGKLNSNAQEDNGKYPFYTCAPNPLKINTYAYNENAILLAGNNANGVFHINKYNGKFNAYQRTYIITEERRKNNLDFIYYCLQLKLNYFKEISQGSATKFLTKKMLDDIEIELPPLETQEKIASILSALDDKIEINNEMNKTLEEMAQTLFKRWFIDFDFPNENGEPYRSSGGKMVDSELGEIPEGWEVKTLKSCTKKITDGTHGTVKDNLYGQYLLLSCKNIKNGTIVLGDKERKIDIETFLKLRKRTELQFNDILLTTVGTIGETAIIRDETINYEFQRSVAILRIDDQILSPELFYIYTKSHTFLSQVFGRVKGSVQKCLFLGEISEIKIIVPAKKDCKYIQNTYEIILKKIKKNQQEIQSLTEIRDTLLPKLMSGEIEV
ncbi:restriction endonuclease subunit S [Cetobacterium somerae]